MSTKVKTKRNVALTVITFVCAIISASLLGLAALWSVLCNSASIIYTVVVSILYKQTWDFYSIMTIVTSLGVNLFFMLLLVAAIVLLLVNRKGPFVFIPMGFFTSSATFLPVSIISLLVLNFGARYGEQFLVKASLISGIVTPILKYALAAIPAVLFFVLAATVFKKLRPIPMAIIHLILCVAFVLNVGYQALIWISNIPNYADIFAYNTGIELISLILTNFIAPILGWVTSLLICGASFFAIFALIPYKKKVAVEAGAGLASVAGTVAKELSADNADVVASEEVSADSADVAASEEVSADNADVVASEEVSADNADVAAPDEAADETVARLNDPAEDKDAEDE